jgi:hypothetical protein
MGAAAAPGKAASPSPPCAAACRGSCPAQRDFNALGAENGPDLARRRERGGGPPQARRRRGERSTLCAKSLIYLIFVA